MRSEEAIKSMKLVAAVELGNVSFEDQQPAQVDSLADLLKGLGCAPKQINPRFFYDARGSELFEKITQLPEYYPTRTEKAILKHNAEDIASLVGRHGVLIEPGSGNCEKVRLLLDALHPSAYIPLDISAEFLSASACQLGKEFSWLNVQAVCADFSGPWQEHTQLPAGKRVVFYPGSTIGNMDPASARAFLSGLRPLIGPGGGVLIGVDLQKSETVLNAAYNDAQGVTAAFNLNVLSAVNAIADADFQLDMFSHQAFYNTERSRIEMHLISKRKQTVNVGGIPVLFEQGESVHTENSYKYSLESFAELAATAGLQVQRSWCDDGQLFSVHYLGVPE